MHRKARTVILILLTLVFVGSIGMMLHQNSQYREGDEVYSEAESLVNLPDLSGFPVPNLQASPSASTSTPGQEPVYVDPYADALRSMDFSALREVNEDVLGWILIPGTKLSYPLVQGEDNSYYLNRTWRKSRNSVGAIFLECTNNRDLSDFNTIIYGHRMNNRSMFGTLKYYKDLSYWEDHPTVYIADDNGSHTYEIFAAYEVSVTGDTYLLGLSSDTSKQSFIDFCLSQSVIDTGVVPSVYDSILTLSTCTGNGHDTRWVVQAVRRGVAPPVQEENTPEPAPEAAPPAAEEPAAPTAPSIPEGPISQDICPQRPGDRLQFQLTANKISPVMQCITGLILFQIHIRKPGSIQRLHGGTCIMPNPYRAIVFHTVLFR